MTDVAPRATAASPAAARPPSPVRRSAAGETKLFLTALALAATVGGWAAISQEGVTPPDASLAVASGVPEDVSPATRSSLRVVTLAPANPPAPVAMTRSSR